MDPSFSISEIFNSSWEIVKKNIWIFATSIFVFFAFFYTIYIASYFTLVVPSLISETPEFNPAAFGIFFMIYFLVLIPLAVYFSTAFFKMSIIAADGEKVELSVFSVPFNTLLHVFLGSFLFSITFYIGFLFCFVPGIYIAIRLQFFMFYIVDKKCNAIDALTNSWAHTKGVEMELFVFGLVQMLVAILGVLCCGVGVFVAYPVICVASALVYRRGAIANPTEGSATPMQQQEIKRESNEF